MNTSHTLKEINFPKTFYKENKSLEKWQEFYTYQLPGNISNTDTNEKNTTAEFGEIRCKAGRWLHTLYCFRIKSVSILSLVGKHFDIRIFL